MMIRLVVLPALAFCLLGLLASAPALAQQYKWVDRNGRVQYGDTPPAGVKATPLRPPPGPSAPPPRAASAPAAKDGKPLTPEEAFRQRQKERQEAEAKAAQESADAQAKRENCAQAQAQLRSLQSGERMMTSNAAGERMYMDDAQRARETERTQKAVSDWCR